MSALSSQNPCCQASVTDSEALPQESPETQALGSAASGFRRDLRESSARTEDCDRPEGIDVPEIPSGPRETQVSPSLCITASLSTRPQRTLPKTHRRNC